MKWSDHDVTKWDGPSSEGTYFCDVPRELGRVTNLLVRNGRLIAETESRIPMIVTAPVYGDDNAE